MKKILCVVLAAALMLACCTACGQKAPSSQQTATSTPPDASSTPSSSSEPEPEPEPEPPPYEPAVLTGLQKGPDYPEGQRITAVMVNNMANSAYHNARPQNGLSSADVLIEIKVEGGITRFCALFTDYKDVPEICPVRSARDQFFQLILPMQAMYVHIGESVVQKQYKKDYSYEDLDIDLDGIPGGFPRDYNRTGVAVEHMAYTDGEHIQEAIDHFGIDTQRTYTSPIFNFVHYDEPARVLTGDDALGIAVVHSQSYRTYFDWDAEKNKYMMSQYALKDRAISPTIDRNTNEQLGFDNVLVLFTDFSVYPDPGGSGYDLQKVDYAAGSVGYYFSGGKAEYIRWKKNSPMEALYLLDGEGNETPIQINTGKTYLAIVDLDEAGEFFYNTEGTAQNGQVERAGDDPETENFVEADY